VIEFRLKEDGGTYEVIDPVIFAPNLIGHLVRDYEGSYLFESSPIGVVLTMSELRTIADKIAELNRRRVA
jgi:hypothetical protein